MSHIYVVLGVATSFVALILAYLRKQRTTSLPLPPSPKSDFLMGHLRSMPSSDEHKVYQQWGEDLRSDIISFTVMGQVTIVLNSTVAATELLAKRSSIYSDRPQLPILCNPNLVGWQNNTGFLVYGDRWRNQRRMSHEFLHKQASKSLWPLVVKHSRLGLQRLIDSPENFPTEIRRISGSLLLSSVYGYEVTTAEDPLVKVVETAIHGLSQAALPSNFYVNIFPWLEYVPAWFPGAEWKRKAISWRADKDSMLNEPFNYTKHQMASGDASPSMLKTLLTDLAKRPSSNEEEEDCIRWATGTLFGAGADTSSSSALVFVLAMILNPDVQAKGQKEIDNLLEGARLPEVEDQESLPYICNIVKEVFRWRTVVPLGVPHACIREDQYKGYRIPKGAVVISNSWAMSNDEDVYTDPDRFNPDRFLDPSVPDAPAFGFGRRSCPGVHLAESALFMTISSLLAIFNINPASDSNGVPIIPKGDMGANLLVSCPVPFECSIVPRSEKHKKLLQEWVEG
ncbi:cytochrome P450 [Ceratobasidium sp. AG-I]|nr:cytochrome P450 [Ceratobasidium sp. AG-I]